MKLSSKIVVKKPKSTRIPAVDEVERTLQAFRDATGLLLCFKLLQRGRPGTGMEILSARHSLHRSDFCMSVKRVWNERCKECDLKAVPERCVKERKVFSHICHAGAGETIIPLLVDDALAGVVYVGQYRTSDDQPKELPVLSASQLEQLEGLSRLLASYLGERLRTPLFVSESSRGFRSEAIHRFLEKTLRENPSMSDLAKHLGLSTTRTAHAVKEATGSSFVALRDALRMERARELLQSTYHKVSHVAAECGFESPQYFHRFFRKQAGVTPLAFRKKHRAEA